MNFIKNKYHRWYNKIITNAQQRNLSKDVYVEKHHVIPKCLGGTNLKDNIVSLVAKEHYICHLLLTKFTEGYELKLMQHALGKFIQKNKHQDRIFKANQYQKIREAISLARRGVKHSEETKKKMSEARKGVDPWNKGVTGIVHSAESNRKRSETLSGRSLTDEQKCKISQSKLGKPSGMLGKTHPRKGTTGMWKWNEEDKLKLSQTRTGIEFSDSHLKNLSDANKLNGLKRRGIKQEIIECPYCKKQGGKNMIKRYHLDNCKNKEV